jgi:hypothetical protein
VVSIALMKAMLPKILHKRVFCFIHSVFLPSGGQW